MKSAAALVGILALLGLGSPAVAQPRTLTVHADQPGHAIPPTLYGVFFEEINHAGDGGLYAELVRNRTLEEPVAKDGTVPGWKPYAMAGAGDPSKITLSLDAIFPKQAATPHSLKIVLAGGSGGVVNDGYWGVPLRKGVHYKARLDVRREGRLDTKFFIGIQPAKGLPYARVRLPGLTAEWKRYEIDLVATTDDADARLSITFDGTGTAWIDNVSLFPVDTWNARPQGLRKDLGDLVAGLAPAFVRFPGGCYVEGGDRLADAFRWPTTIGDIADRPGHSNATWGYWSSDGLGFHEYLQWCEDLKAAPLFVVNCGISHKEVASLGELAPWIRECLEAIEYANGGVETRWGAARAKNGHPAPFNLKYVEIGNENGMFGGSGGTREQYSERYKRFYDAIKAKYPQIVTIANTRVDAPMELVDDHYYNSPPWFWNNVGLYDKADRKGPKIYVGEYAVTQGCGTGNLAAALAEAAFMTGMERNSDLVVMSSYAPMFVHAADRKWNPDMMVFDGLRSYGTPSYHVQVMFAKNRPDTLLPVDVPEVQAAPAITKGGIGLGTWLTQAEYKDIVVELGGKAVYTSDFTTGTEGWKPGAGDWKVVGGAYRQSTRAEKQLALLDLPALRDAADYTVHLKARKLGGDEGFLILFRAQGADNCTWWNIGGWGNREHGIEKSAAGGKSGVGARAAGKIETGRWYDVKIEATGASIRCWLDGKPVHEVEEKPTPTFAAVAGRVDATGEIIVKVVNGGESPVRARVALPGAGKLEPNGKAVVLTSAALNDENSFENPTKITARTRALDGVSDNFPHEFPARSVTVLRLKTTK